MKQLAMSGIDSLNVLGNSTSVVCHTTLLGDPLDDHDCINNLNRLSAAMTCCKVLLPVQRFWTNFFVFRPSITRIFINIKSWNIGFNINKR